MSIKAFAAASAFALLASGAVSGSATAMPLGGLSDASAAVSTQATNVRWVCGPVRCWWRPAPYYYGYYAPPRPYFYGRRYWGPRYRYGWYGPRRHYWR
ncbi:MAG: hypothetical protein AB7K64_02475 [Variibacter sp.]